MCFLKCPNMSLLFPLSDLRNGYSDLFSLLTSVFLLEKIWDDHDFSCGIATLQNGQWVRQSVKSSAWPSKRFVTKFRKSETFLIWLRLNWDYLHSSYQYHKHGSFPLYYKLKLCETRCFFFFLRKNTRNNERKKEEEKTEEKAERENT